MANEKVVRTVLCMLICLFVVGTVAAAASGEGPRTCGPPPRAKPQHRTGGESFPPLPLPATPLRRSEKKRQPAPPALVGKVILGDVKWKNTDDGRRFAFRDWKTDPGDIQQLLRWTNAKLGVRYRPVDLDLNKFSYDPTELPILFFTGHDSFKVDPKAVAKLRQFVTDGGTMWGDACCGSEDFWKSFLTLVKQMFPNRPFRPLAEDNPIYHCFYNINSVEFIEEGKGNRRAPPMLLGLNIGCRTAVVGWAHDMSCGWDGHTHPQGKRVVPRDARLLGANLITYALADYELGRFLATEKIFHQKGQNTRDQLVIAQVMHGGDWDPQPSSIASLLKHLAENTTVEVQFKKENVDLRNVDAYQHPIIYMTGHRTFTLADVEVTNLRRFLGAGGVIVSNACCGRKGFDTAFRREIARVMPKHELRRVPLDHPVFSSVFNITTVEFTPLLEQERPGLNVPVLEGISIDGQLRVIYSQFGLVNGWSGAPNPYARGYRSSDALRIGINVLVYSMTH